MMGDGARAKTTAVAFPNVVPGRFAVGALTLLAWAGLAVADNKDKPDFQPDANKPVLSPDEQTGVGAASLFLDGFPKGTESFSELALLSAGEHNRLWAFWDASIVRRLPVSMLEFVQDGAVLPKDPGDKELDAYFTMMIYADRTAPEAFDKAANPDADWFHVFQEPHNYRGDVVHFEGKLKRLRETEPPEMASQAGVRHYYEGFLYADILENDPVFFIITDLPKGLRPGDHLDVKVGFSGYFYKKFRYTAGDTEKTKKDRLAPLCIGRTLTLLTEPPAVEPPPDPSWVAWLGPTFFGVIGLSVAVLFGLGFWFRRGDSRVRSRLYAARHAEFIGPPPEEATGGESKPPGESPRNRLSEGPGDRPKSET